MQLDSISTEYDDWAIYQDKYSICNGGVTIIDRHDAATIVGCKRWRGPTAAVAIHRTPRDLLHLACR